MQVGLVKNYSNKMTNVQHPNMQHSTLLQNLASLWAICCCDALSVVQVNVLNLHHWLLYSQQWLLENVRLTGFDIHFGHTKYMSLW